MAPEHSHLLKVGGRYMLRYESYLAGIKALSITKKTSGDESLRPSSPLVYEFFTSIYEVTSIL